MPKIAKPLTAVAVRQLTEPGLHSAGGVPGLQLQVTPSGARTWILRAMIGGKRRDIGLGGFPAVSLAQARESATAARQKIAEGIDPIQAKRDQRQKLAASLSNFKTFDECADDYIESMRASWKNQKHKKQWSSTIKKYASPVIGSMPVSDVQLAHVLRILEPIWLERNETASRLRGRLELILSWATTRGYRQGDNPAKWRGHLETILAKPSKVQKTQHFPAIAYQELTSFVADLRQHDGMAAKALECCILTAARSGEVRGATWNEIDLESKVWIIGAHRMKAGREHRIPLSDAAIALLTALPRIPDCAYIFPAPRSGQLSDMTLTALIRRMHESKQKADGIGYVDRLCDNRTITVHGMRSAFRDWAGETTAFAREVIEHALAHQLADKAEAAYARGSLFEKRRELMAAWAAFVGRIQATSSVVPIRRKA